MPTPAAAPLRRLLPLDGLRGIAATSVLLFHMQVPALLGGALGVDLFFVLSGFLITTLLLTEVDRRGRLDLARFWARRAVRLWPPLFAVVLLCVPFARTMSSGNSLRSFAHEAFEATTWSMNIATALHPATRRPLGFSWTLAMEEQFYLVWPLVLLAAAAVGVGRRRLAGIAVAGGLASWAVLLLDWHSTSFEAAVYTRPDARALPVLLGCALALVLAADGAEGTGRLSPMRALLGHPVTATVALAAVGAAFLVPGMLHLSNRVTTTAGSLVMSAGTTVLVGAIVARPRGGAVAVLRSRPLVALGAISYSLYLVQKPALAIAFTHDGGHLPRHGIALRATEVAIVLSAAVALWALVERPARLLSRRIVPRPVERDAGAARVRRLHPRRGLAALGAALGAVPVLFVATGAAAALRWTRHEPTPGAPVSQAAPQSPAASPAATLVPTPAHDRSPDRGPAKDVPGTAGSSHPSGATIPVVGGSTSPSHPVATPTIAVPTASPPVTVPPVTMPPATVPTVSLTTVPVPTVPPSPPVSVRGTTGPTLPPRP
ncbi:MAG TPA: acyltransferase family protein [Mycobacteriales bacterium]|nr:acyltransferase family protein [Mycobacteriales bacterium]